MKNIVTALNNPVLNERLREEENFNVLSNDIQYQEGIFEVIENFNNIDYLIISEILQGEYKIKSLINKIQEINNKIKIIMILDDKDSELENYFYSKGILKIFYNNKTEINEIINLIKNNNNLENEKIINEIENLKNIIIKNNIKKEDEENIIKNNINSKNNKKINVNNFNKLINKIKEKNKLKINNKKIISILGTGGVGKSILTINIANLLYKNNFKVLIIDFDILNNSLHTILDVDKYPENIKDYRKINNLIINIDKNLDLIEAKSFIFNKEYKIDTVLLNEVLDSLIEKYDFIIIDTSSDSFLDFTKNIIKRSHYNIYLLESNILEIKKAKTLLDIYYNKWNIEKNRIKLLINKYNRYSIKSNIIKELFYEYKILGKVKYNLKYNLLINNKYKKNVYIKNKISSELKQIVNKL